MAELAAGWYFVHCFQLEDVLIRVPAYERRDTLVQYPQAFRYQAHQLQESAFWINELGAVIVFQRLPAVSDRASAFAAYRDKAVFRSLYKEAVDWVNRFFKQPIPDSDVSFLFELSASSSEPEAIWEFVSWPAANPAERCLLIESIFVYQLCKSLEVQLNRLVRTRVDFGQQMRLAQSAESLFHLEDPEQFLVSKREIALITPLFEAWGIARYVSTLKSRFEQSITNYTFFRDQRTRERENLMNLLLAAIAILSVIQIVPSLEPPLTSSDAQRVNIVMAVVAVLILAVAIARFAAANVVGPLRFWWRNRRAEWRLKADTRGYPLRTSPTPAGSVPKEGMTAPDRIEE